MGAWKIKHHPERIDITFGDGSVFTVDDEEVADLVPEFIKFASRMRFPMWEHGCVINTGFDAAAADIAYAMTRAGQKEYAKVSWAIQVSQLNPYLHAALCMLVSKGCSPALHQIAPNLWSGRMTIAQAVTVLTEAHRAHTA
ncbi:hypothetical protein [Magnetospirillum sp. 15-1]|uniref:hypothetical protein n=1 Tax=Magnetospirillum sp. 15-1 TaxID=1979370 RepID=UPI000BBC17C7|nr:hypothetical protein [Magnetospirillum sp. 15-1]